VTRIIAGAAKGRRLVTPPGPETRPTSDRVREALFSMLEARGAVDGARVLDLFAGSGALGFEAASRGAASVTLVDDARPAVTAARRNADTLRELGRVEVVQAPALRYLQRPGPPLDLVLLDPPYALAEDELTELLAALAASGRLADDALVVVERGSRSPMPRWPDGLVPERDRRYGETVLWTAVREDAER
jgi:16S rRNA (guanine966-N2)-methyltransferase